MKQPVSRKFIKKKAIPFIKKGELKSKDKFSSNSRPNPEKNSLSQRVFIVLACFVSGILLMVLLFQENAIHQDVVSLQILDSERVDIQKQILQWQHIMTTYPDYRDGYFRLATLEYQLGNRNNAQMYDQKALQLDPNFQQGRELAGKLK